MDFSSGFLKKFKTLLLDEFMAEPAFICQDFCYIQTV